MIGPAPAYKLAACKPEREPASSYSCMFHSQNACEAVDSNRLASIGQRLVVRPAGPGPNPR